MPAPPEIFSRVPPPQRQRRDTHSRPGQIWSDIATFGTTSTPDKPPNICTSAAGSRPTIASGRPAPPPDQWPDADANQITASTLGYQNSAPVKTTSFVSPDRPAEYVASTPFGTTSTTLRAHTNAERPGPPAIHNRPTFQCSPLVPPNAGPRRFPQANAHARGASA